MPPLQHRGNHHESECVLIADHHFRERADQIDIDGGAGFANHQHRKHARGIPDCVEQAGQSR